MKEWCEKERRNSALVEELQQQHERAKSSAQQLEELTHEEGALRGVVIRKKAARERMRRAREKLIRARKAATKASAEVGAAYTLAIQATHTPHDSSALSVID